MISTRHNSVGFISAIFEVFPLEWSLSPNTFPEEYSLRDNSDIYFFHKQRIMECGGRHDRLCGLVVRVPGYRSGGPVSIPGTTSKKIMGLERGALSLVSTTEELLDRKVAAPV
jgi:hypothetical protein